jgi:hypothetical protein
MLAQRLARWTDPVHTSLVTRPMALVAARSALCGLWGRCDSCRNTVLYPNSVHIVQLRLVWLDICNEMHYCFRQ